MEGGVRGRVDTTLNLILFRTGVKSLNQRMDTLVDAIGSEARRRKEGLGRWEIAVARGTQETTSSRKVFARPRR